MHSHRRLRLENLIALGQCDPRLLAPRPDMPRWPQPGYIIQGAGPHPDHTVPRSAAYPRAARRAHKSAIHASAVGSTLEPTWFDAAELESSLGNNHPQGKGAARQALAIGAV